MKKISFVLSIFIIQYAAAQHYAGSSLPDITLGSQLYKSQKKIQLSQFKEQLILLDLMSIHCSSCIKALPKYDSLQRIFASEVKFIILVKDSKKKVEEFFKAKGLDTLKALLFLARDQMVDSNFNIVAMPQVAWLGRQKNIRAITMGDYVSGENIRKLLKDDTDPDWLDVSLPPDLPLIDVAAIDNSSRSAYFSLVQGFRKGYNSKKEFFVDSSRGLQHWNLTNFTLSYLYEIAIKPLAPFKISPGALRFIPELKDSVSLNPKTKSFTYTEWSQKYRFSYESVLPLHINIIDRHKKMLADLNYYLNMNGRFEKRNMECLLLDFASVKSNPDLNRTEEIHVATVGELMTTLESHNKKAIFVTNDQLTQPLKISFTPQELRSVDLLTSKLNLFGIRCSSERRVMDVFVLSE